MKANTHPTYYPDAHIICSCGNTFTVGATKPEIHVELCSKCHPFYTGQQKFIDTVGRIEKFQKRQAKAIVYKQAQKEKKEKVKKQESYVPKTLKEMLMGKS